MAPLIGAATAYRAGVSYANAWYKRAPRIAELWIDAVEPGPQALVAAGELRKEMLETGKKSIRHAWHEMDRGLDDLEHYSDPKRRSS